jgi:methylthioribose-1-phosphate isomerase
VFRTLYWKRDKVFILDQRLLPHKIKYIECKNHLQVAAAIKDMALRGAPAIGVAAGFGTALSSIEKKFTNLNVLKSHVERAVKALSMTRPTAVNLFWALKRMSAVLDKAGTVRGLQKALIKEASGIYAEDIAINKSIGEYGSKLIKKGSCLLTHCNAGALATAGYGTALGVIRSAWEKGKIRNVFVDETRPYLQGARLTAWELREEGIPHVLITDNMAGYFMGQGLIHAVIVGADRIASNGDTANKIGTYSLGVLAAYHSIPFYVAAPVSTIDPSSKSGRDIKIEERSTKEVLLINGKLISSGDTPCRHPAFDVTPAKLITRIITNTGVYRPQDITKSLVRSPLSLVNNRKLKNKD